jgi:hypothetical protein
VCEEERRKYERGMKRACVCDEKKGGMEEEKKMKGKKGNGGDVWTKGEGEERKKKKKEKKEEKGGKREWVGPLWMVGRKCYLLTNPVMTCGTVRFPYF